MCLKFFKSILFTLTFSIMLTNAFGQDGGIDIPEFNDKYSNYVKQLESGDLNIDYLDFRRSFLNSKQFDKKGDDYRRFKKQMFAEAANKNYSELIRLAKAMLNIDYTSMYAHKYLQQTYKILGEENNYQKYHDIEFGLLNSIVKNGDGKTCETGWPVTQIEEEYFIIDMLGARLQQQSIAKGGNNICDRMEIKLKDGETRVLFFEANKVFEKEQELLKRKE